MSHLHPEEVLLLPKFTPERPMKLLVSACLVGVSCGVDGSSYDDLTVLKLVRLPNVNAVKFCPEHFSFGTPRGMPDIHGGNGFDVLDGKAKVLSDKGEDWTAGMIAAAHEMLKLAQAENIDLAILQNMSAACGTSVISDGCRLVKVRKFQKGPGVCSALLMRNGFRVVNIADLRTLELLHKELDPNHEIDQTAINYDESDWFHGYFGK